MKKKLEILSWIIFCAPIMIALVFGFTNKASDIISYIIPWGLIGMCVSAIFDYVFNLPMRVSFARAGTKNEEVRLRAGMLLLGIAMGVIGVIIIVQ